MEDESKLYHQYQLAESTRFQAPARKIPWDGPLPGTLEDVAPQQTNTLPQCGCSGVVSGEDPVGGGLAS